jgi:molecular chaperone DnaK (HSP70)
VQRVVAEKVGEEKIAKNVNADEAGVLGALFSLLDNPYLFARTDHPLLRNRCCPLRCWHYSRFPH